MKKGPQIVEDVKKMLFAMFTNILCGLRGPAWTRRDLGPKASGRVRSFLVLWCQQERSVDHSSRTPIDEQSNTTCLTKMVVQIIALNFARGWPNLWSKGLPPPECES